MTTGFARFPIAILAAASISTCALAGPIAGPVWVVDAPTAAVATFTHGAILANANHALGPFASPGGNWSILALNIFELDKADPGSGGLDAMSASARFQHLVAPHAGEAAPNGAFGTGVAGLNPPALTISTSGSIAHPAHSDSGLLTITPVLNANGADYDSYTITITLSHSGEMVPEPGTWALGLAGLLLLRLASKALTGSA